MGLILLFCVVGLVVAFLIGPREIIHGVVKHIDLPDDLDRYLRESEGYIELLTPGTEKRIIWLDPENPSPSEVSIIYLHGFSASRQEIAPVCDLLAKRYNANLFYTRLSGHGCDGEAMRQISGTALLHDAAEAMAIGKRIGKKVIVIGNSTGATLATWLAEQDAENAIHSLVLLSPNFGLRQKTSELILLPWGRLILRLLQGPTYRFRPANEKQSLYWTTTFPSEALIPMMGLIRFVRNSCLEGIQIPTLVLYSPTDQVLDVKKIRKHIARIASEKKIVIEIEPVSDKKHVLAGDILSSQTTEQVVNEISDFLQTCNQTGKTIV